MSQKSNPAPSPKKNSRETREPVLRQAAMRKLPGRVSGKGELFLPAVPALVDHYVQLLNSTWIAIGRAFKPEELDYLRQTLENVAKEGFAVSASSKIHVSYETDPPPKTSLTWTINLHAATLEQTYADWVTSRTPPLFGAHPDAKPLALARELGEPAQHHVLDVGAGTGRNTLPLAKEGFATDAIEPAPALAKILRDDAEQQQLAIRVFGCDVLQLTEDVPKNHYHLVLLSEVVASHFSNLDQLRRLFVAAGELLAPGGLLVFNAFLAVEGYKPDDFVRQMAQLQWCCIYTRGQLREAAQGAPFELLSNESTLEYEKANTPPEHWPPTGWYESWSAGLDLFDLTVSKSPVELRWLVYRKR